jgi:hypothetical protein
MLAIDRRNAWINIFRPRELHYETSQHPTPWIT